MNVNELKFEKICHATYSKSFESVEECKFKDVVIRRNSFTSKNVVGLPVGKTTVKYFINKCELTPFQLQEYLNRNQ